MASLGRECERGRDGWRLRFSVLGKRKAIWLSGITEPEAHVWKQNVEQLLSSPIISRSTAAWLAGLTIKQKAKLSAVGLIECQATPPTAQSKEAPKQLKAFIDWYIKRRTVKATTREKWDQTRDALTRYFGDSRDIRTISSADAEAWREWLAAFGNNREGKPRKAKPSKNTKTKSGSNQADKSDSKQTEKPVRTDLADNTVRRRTGIAKQFFNYAIKAELLTKNPFVGLPSSVQGNEAKQYFVTDNEFDAMIDACNGAEWEAVIALSRIGGLRCPSEVLRLKWEDVDFAGYRLRIHSSKTEHHKNGGVRDCPLFPKLRPYLESLAELAKARGAKPTDYVLTRRGSESVFRTGLLRILKRAGLTPWPKLFQNMRASRETELLDEFPIKDVCAWIGNSQAVAMKHYAMRRQDSFMRAAGVHIGVHNTRQAAAAVGNEQAELADKNNVETQGKEGVLPLAATGGKKRQTKKSGRGGTSIDCQ